MPEAKVQQVHLNRIIDGDTVEVELPGSWIQSTKKVRIRLWGIDAPESSQPLGDKSTDHLVKIVGGKKKIYLESVATDQYHRIVGIIHPGKPRKGQEHKSYNCRMVADGWAYTYMLSGYRQEAYRNAETQAKSKKRGVWKVDPNSKAGQVPWEYRKGEKAKAKKRSRRWIYLAAGLAIGAYFYWFITQHLIPRLAG